MVLRIRVNAALSDLFRERRIFLRPPADAASQPDWLLCAEECQLEAYSHVFHPPFLPLRLGAFSYSHAPISPNVVVGRFCSIGANVSWIAENHPLDRVSTHPASYGEPPLAGVAAFCADQGTNRYTTPYDIGSMIVWIGHDVWIGHGASIMPGVRIGTGAVVAAGALVTSDVEPYTIVGGLPAKPVRKRFPEETIARLLKSEWWNCNPHDLFAMDMSDPAAFLDRLEEADPPIARISFKTVTAEEMVRVSNA